MQLFSYCGLRIYLPWRHLCRIALISPLLILYRAVGLGRFLPAYLFPTHSPPHISSIKIRDLEVITCLCPHTSDYITVSAESCYTRNTPPTILPKYCLLEINFIIRFEAGESFQHHTLHIYASYIQLCSWVFPNLSPLQKKCFKSTTYFQLKIRVLWDMTPCNLIDAS
jgi:hypothetical protein